MASEADIAWAAGLFEGEGHFTVRRVRDGWRAQFEMGVTSTDEDVIKRFHRIAECGYLKNRRMRNAQPHWKAQYQWNCGGATGLAFATTIKPYLGERRTERLEEIISLIADSQPRQKNCEQCGQTFTPTRFARQRFCREKCRDRSKYLRRLAAKQLPSHGLDGEAIARATTRHALARRRNQR